jgi:hypothetical protein
MREGTSLSESGVGVGIISPTSHHSVNLLGVLSFAFTLLRGVLLDLATLDGVDDQSAYGIAVDEYHCRRCRTPIGKSPPQYCNSGFNAVQYCTGVKIKFRWEGVRSGLGNRCEVSG